MVASLSNQNPLAAEKPPLFVRHEAHHPVVDSECISLKITREMVLLLAWFLGRFLV